MQKLRQMLGPKRWRSVCGSLSLLLCQPLGLQAATLSEANTGSELKSVSFLKAGPASVAVLEPEFHGSEAALANAFVDRLRARLFRSGAVNVIERQQLHSLLKEQAFQSSVYCGQSCISELGRTLGVDYLVFSTVNQIGSLYALSVRVVRVSDGELTEVLTDECRCPVDQLLTNRVQQLGDQVLNTLAPGLKTGALTLQTEPAGARIRLNAQNWGQTPLTLRHIPAGRYQLELSYPGHQTVHKIIEIESQQQENLHFRLPRQLGMGVVNLLSEPTGVNVYLNQQLLGQTPLKHQEIPVGEYLLSFEKKGYLTAEERLLVLGGEPQTHSTQLRQAIAPSGSLQIDSTPAGADVFLNHSWLGKTPLTRQQLPIGKHQLVLQKEGYQLTELSIELDASQPLVLNQALQSPLNQWLTWGVLGGILVTSLAMGAMQRQRALVSSSSDSAQESGFGITGLAF